MKRIVTVLGARPQFIKAAVVSKEIAKWSDVEEVILHTGQHYDYNMSDLFFQQLEIPKPYKNLSVGSGNHGFQTGEMLKLIETELLEIKPDLVIVYGDTNSTLAGALAASKLHIPVAHIESGLRSFNRRMPEEINRVITDHLSDFLFVPALQAQENLVKEGIRGDKVYLTGDVMYDALLLYGQLKLEPGVLERLNLQENDYILVTLHRAENTDNLDRLRLIIDKLKEIAQHKKVVFPAHPRTGSILRQFSDIKTDGIKIIEPLGYLEMLQAQRFSRLIITDSGGVQKEAFMNNKYCLTLRDETEWVELVNGGFNFLVSSVSKLNDYIDAVWDKKFENRTFKPYGDGKASQKIVTILRQVI